MLFVFSLSDLQIIIPETEGGSGWITRRARDPGESQLSQHATAADSLFLKANAPRFAPDFDLKRVWSRHKHHWDDWGGSGIRLG